MVHFYRFSGHIPFISPDKTQYRMDIVSEKTVEVDKTQYRVQIVRRQWR